MKAYRCMHSGLLLPPDYKQNWGIFYGHGLGVKPVSECLDSDMRAKMDLTRANYTDHPNNYMFPFHITHADIELVDVSQEEFDNPDNRLILAIDDPNFKLRSEILRRKQREKPEWSQLEIARSAKPSTERTPWRAAVDTIKPSPSPEPQPQE